MSKNLSASPFFVGAKLTTYPYRFVAPPYLSIINDWSLTLSIMDIILICTYFPKYFIVNLNRKSRTPPLYNSSSVFLILVHLLPYLLPTRSEEVLGGWEFLLQYFPLVTI